MSKANKLLSLFVLLWLGPATVWPQTVRPPRPRPARVPARPQTRPPAPVKKPAPADVANPAHQSPTIDNGKDNSKPKPMLSAPNAARNAALLDATAQVLRETSALRQLPVLRPVPSGTQSRDEIAASLTADLDRISAAIRTDEILYRQMGLVAPDFQLRPFLLELLTEQVAGYYDIRAGRFYVADWIGLDQQKPVMAHELTHALQDQHFNLRRFLDAKAATDTQLAVSALIEGDALLVMQQYIQSNPLRLLNANRAGQLQAMTPTFDRAPRILRETLTFPYRAGLVWAAQIQQRGGWAAVSQAYTDLPQSSMHILHPATYLARVAPVAVALPDAAPELGANWQRVGYDVRGEWQYFLLLDSWLKDETVSRNAAEGWRGDRCAVYANPHNGQTLVAQSSVWATENDAQEFFQAWTRRNDLQYQTTAQPLTAAQPLAAQDANTLTWTTPAGHAWLIRRGPQIWLLHTNAPALSRAQVAAVLGLPSLVPEKLKADFLHP